MILDDNALFRHPEFSQLLPEDPLEGEAAKEGFAFVRLDGNIAVVGNGAGLVLSTLDLVADAGGKPACFLDLGGGSQQSRVEAALRLVKKLPNAERILVNIFGGITRTTDVAAGLKNVVERRADAAGLRADKRSGGGGGEEASRRHSGEAVSDRPRGREGRGERSMILPEAGRADNRPGYHRQVRSPAHQADAPVRDERRGGRHAGEDGREGRGRARLRQGRTGGREDRRQELDSLRARPILLLGGRGGHARPA